MSNDIAKQVHATCVSLYGAGLIIRGPSGAGKSDLALRLIDRGARLVADDRVDLLVSDNGVIARAPETLAGLLEVRGLGILRVPVLVHNVIRAVAAERVQLASQLIVAGSEELLADLEHRLPGCRHGAKHWPMTLDQRVLSGELKDTHWSYRKRREQNGIRAVVQVKLVHHLPSVTHQR